jgi:hypothetical protein
MARSCCGFSALKNWRFFYIKKPEKCSFKKFRDCLIVLSKAIKPRYEVPLKE